ncbi:MAG: MFS transporter, partial [Verrucomicrobiales bacterium]
MSKNPAGSGTRFAFSAVTTLFFLWGFITCMNDLLIPKFKEDFDLNQFQANAVQFAFFGAYFIISLIYFIISSTTGDPINRIGYKNGLVLGLVVAGIGCLMFYPAAETYQFWLFLAALGVLGAGVTLIQIAANPYVTILGPEKSGSSRLNLAQGFCSLGYVIAPFIGGILIFGSEVFESPLIDTKTATETLGHLETFAAESKPIALDDEETRATLETILDGLAQAKTQGLTMTQASELRESSLEIVEKHSLTPAAEQSWTEANRIIRHLQLEELDSLKAPYLGLGAAFFIIAAAFKMISLPTFTQEGKIEPGITAFKHKHFVWGWLAIFFYVGSEVTIGSILVNYLGDETVAGLPENEADKYLSFCWGGLMIGRLMGAISLGDIQASRKLPYMVLAAIVSTAIIYTCATFNQFLTVGEHINPAEILPFI